MREIEIIRKKRFFGAIVQAIIVVDGYVVAKVKNGETVKITIDDNPHEIFAATTEKGGCALCIEAGDQNLTLYLKPVVNSFNLYAENNADGGQSPYVKPCESVQAAPAPPQSQVPSIAFGGILSLILMIVCCCVFAENVSSVFGFVAGMILAVASGAVIIMGGFWFVIIPLPIIYIWKSGCVKPNQSLKRKIILGILAFILPVLSILLLFLL